MTAHDIRSQALALTARRRSPTKRSIPAPPLQGMARGPSVLTPGPRAGIIPDRLDRDVLVTIFLRGGIDGLSTVVPYGDDELYNLRPNLAVAPPGQPDGAVDLDGFFGLPPAAAPLLTPYHDGRLLLVHASGSLDPTRSHFDAMHVMETAKLQVDGYETSGWTARHLQTVEPLGAGTLRGLAISQLAPRMLAEAPATLPIADPASFAFPGRVNTAQSRREALASMYAQARQPYAAFGASTFATYDLVGGIDFNGYVPSNGAVYENEALHVSLMRAATMIKARSAVENYHIDVGGWDHHEQQGPIDGTYAGMIGNLARALEAFYLDMLGEWDHTTLVIQSEFGRRAYENGSLGTDHGRGNMMMVMGGHILGGRVLSDWPGLDSGSLEQGEDLAVTIDYRDILSEIISKRLGNRGHLDYVFPDYTPNFRGIVI
jgi:uncharacterized protein (DUF1501 family)